MKRRRLLFSQGRLPSEYQEVEWIESSGTQYINTGVVASPASNFNVDLEMLLTSSGGYSSLTLSILGANASYDSGIAITRDDSNYYGFRASKGNGVKETGVNPVLLQKYHLKIEDNLFYVDDDSFAMSIGSNGYLSTPVYLFGLNRNNAFQTSTGVSMRLFYCKVYNYNELVRDFIPCYRKSDREIGMYDLVTETFFTNAGTGTFAKGPDVLGGGIICNLLQKLSTRKGVAA